MHSFGKTPLLFCLLCLLGFRLFYSTGLTGFSRTRRAPGSVAASRRGWLLPDVADQRHASAHQHEEQASRHAQHTRSAGAVRFHRELDITSLIFCERILVKTQKNTEVI